MVETRRALLQHVDLAETGCTCWQSAMPRFVAAVVSVAFLWTLALAVAPHLHERIHADANQVEHSCAVTFIASGNYHHSVSAPPAASSIAAIEFSVSVISTDPWVQSLFLGAHVFEHAPPQNS